MNTTETQVMAQESVAHPCNPTSSTPLPQTLKKTVLRGRRLPLCFRALLLGVLVGSLGPSSALAQPTKKDRAAAEALFLAAKRLMESNQYAEACPKLEESQQHDPAVGTLLYLAHCYEKTNRSATAWATWRAAESMARSAKQAERERTAREHAEALERVLSSLKIEVPAASQIPGLEIKRDGVIVGKGSIGEAIPIDQGEHVVEASAPGRKPWKKTIKVEKAQAHETIEIPLLESAETAPPPPPPSATAPAPQKTETDAGEPAASAEPPPPSAPSSTQKTLGYTAIVVGLAGLGVSAYYGFRARSKEDDSDKHCLPQDRNQCDAIGLSLNQEAQDAQKIALAALAGGGLATVVGIVLVVSAPKPSPTTTTATVRVSPSLGGLVLSGTW